MASDEGERPTLQLHPIGTIHTPFSSKRSAPRQSALAADVQGRVELLPRAELEHALQDIEQWSHLWLLFWFHQNQGWNAKVAPPRSARKRGLFATRAPYRPNPIGISAVQLERVEGRTLFVRGVDMINGTPLLDIKPYVPYTDAIDANSGWLGAEADQGPRYRVVWGPDAAEQLQWLERQGVSALRRGVEEALALGPTPHAYRRIRQLADGFRLSFEDFRVRFQVSGEQVVIVRVETGYRASVLRDPTASPRAATPLEVHRAFVTRFGVTC